MRPTWIKLAVLLCLTPLALAPRLEAQKPDAPKNTPDVLIFTNGDQLTGKLQSAAGGSIVFASDMAGTLTVPFDKVKEVRSGSGPAEFALLKKGVPVTKVVTVPEGTAEIADGKVEIVPAPGATTLPTSVPAKDVDYLVARAEFEKEISGHHSFTEGWSGTATGGATLVRSTQTGTTLTAALNLVRAIPVVGWLAPRNRTTLNVAESYGKTTTPGAVPQTVPPTPSVTTLTNIFHADAERDEYLSHKLYVLGDTSFDHNYSQGLALEQVYGGGFGYTAIKSAKQELDLKADIHYARQSYLSLNGSPVTPAVGLVGATFFEGYHRNLPHKLVFTQTANILPAFNNATDYSANLTAALSVPVFKRLSASVLTTDNYLNDPAAGYNKNSYQFITGVTYNIK